MKATGIIRRVDKLGRVVLPKELRRTFEIEKDNQLEISVDDEWILLKKYQPACILCGKAGDLVEYKGKKICRKCIEETIKG